MTRVPVGNFSSALSPSVSGTEFLHSLSPLFCLCAAFSAIPATREPETFCTCLISSVIRKPDIPMGAVTLCYRVETARKMLAKQHDPCWIICDIHRFHNDYLSRSQAVFTVQCANRLFTAPIKSFRCIVFLKDNPTEVTDMCRVK